MEFSPQYEFHYLCWQMRCLKGLPKYSNAHPQCWPYLRCILQAPHPVNLAIAVGLEGVQAEGFQGQRLLGSFVRLEMNRLTLASDLRRWLAFKEGLTRSARTAARPSDGARCRAAVQATMFVINPFVRRLLTSWELKCCQMSFANEKLFVSYSPFLWKLVTCREYLFALGDMRFYLTILNLLSSTKNLSQHA